MKKLAILICLALPHLALCQIEINMISGMDGELLLEDGSTTNFWGYGYEGPGGGLVLPAPLLELTVGDEVNFNFTNVSAEAHTIHLHGLDVNQANDGVPLTSFQVFQNQSGTYSFTATEPGTYLYHCHVTTTLHLTMGMYGMIVVHEELPVLFSNGPGYSDEHTYLFSDLEIAVNDVPTDAYPFHDIDPDYFMVNGLQGEMIAADNSQAIMAQAGDSIALRVGSMAYSKIVMHFPSELNAVVYMSDGRALPQAFAATELEIYPGERFSLICQPQGDFAQAIQVDYYDMLNGELEHSNMINVIDLDVGIEETNIHEIKNFFPNPARDVVQYESVYDTKLFFYSAQGKCVYARNVKQGANNLNLGLLPSGLYLAIDEFGKSSRIVIEK